MKGINWILLLILFTGCEEILFEEEKSDTPISNFDHLWEAADQRYSFFELKGIDWDEYYRTNRPRVDNSMSDIELFDLLAEMLNSLRDGHVNLVSPFNVSRFDIDFLGPDNFEWRIIKENYIGDDFLITGPFSHDFLADGEVGYIRYSSFSATITDFDMAFIASRYRNTRGLILDLRENGGGSISNVYRLLDRFQRQPVFLYTSQIKSGPGHEEFTTAAEVFTDPDPPFYTSPIVVLTDRQSYSASSLFTLGARAMPNMTVIGDTTGGGLGLPNGGQLPNGWTYRFSITRTLDPQGNNFENGVPPDIVSLMTDEERVNGVDRVIEDAIDFLTN
ncbi:MAG: S41 family peptidase [Bacteroidota bacterium]